MLDIAFIRANKEVVIQACINKRLDSAVVEKLLELDEKRRKLQGEVDALREQANKQADEIKKAVFNGGKPTPEQVEAGKKIKEQLKNFEPDLKATEIEYDKALLFIPNIPAADVPIGDDESGNQVVRTVGDIPEFDFEPLPHHILLEKRDFLDTKRAVEIGGFRSYFLKNDGLLLEQALLSYAQDLLITKGFSPMSVPVLVNDETMWGTGYLPWGLEDHYKTQDGQTLAGTAEVALTAYHQNQTFKRSDLPIKMMGISPCFRREVGSYGKDTQGVIRVHQFTKVEQVVLTVADEDETRSWHETMVGLSEMLLTNLGLPYHILLMCTGDMGAGQRKKYDIETWFPSQNTYRETHSASYFNDFQARRLNMRYQDTDGTLKYVYTLNNTMAASPRLLAALVENYQNPDGSIRIPEVLQPYIKKDTI